MYEENASLYDAGKYFSMDSGIGFEKNRKALNGWMELVTNK